MIPGPGGRCPGLCAPGARRIAYLRELGVTYLHLMPLLRPRDGGYAVADASGPRVSTLDIQRIMTKARADRAG